VAAALAPSVALPVVCDCEGDMPVVVADEDFSMLGARVLEGVRQTLLDEAVGREVETGCELNRVAFDLEDDR
jgi:hypothetical protein